MDKALLKHQIKYTVATYNVARFEMLDSSSILKVLEDEHIDICGLQEVPGNSKLQKLLSRQSTFIGLFDNLYVSYGNGLIYRKDKFTLKSHKLHILRNGQNKKSALEVSLEHVSGEIVHLYVTHLNHRTEQQRLFEINNLLKITEVDNSTHFILGDLNSLKRSDYNDDDWNTITQVRLDNKWESPQIDVVNKIETAGYTDLLNDNVIPTSRFNTRVDYIFSNHTDLKYNASVIVNNNNQSDHKPVMINVLM